MAERSMMRLTAALVLTSASVSACMGETPIDAQRVAETSTAFGANADTYVDAGSPLTNFGSSVQLAVDGIPIRQTFLKFAVNGLSGTVTRATLRLHVDDGPWTGSENAGALASVSDTSWSEADLNYTNRPDVDGVTLDTLGRVAPNTWYDVDVTSAVTGDRTYSFALSTTTGDSARFDSREDAAVGPQLVVTTDSSEQPPPPPPPPPAATDAVLVGAGDISSCNNNNDDATAKLLDDIAGTVFTAGDAAYQDGSAANFNDCYDPTWGRHKARTRPVPGNHEYQTSNASGYHDYFGAAAGVEGRAYYSYDVGDWHVVGINSNCSQIGGCGAGSAQERWLRQDLAASSARCTIAFWHHPLFTSGATHPPATQMRPIFDALYDYGADVVVTGHNHNYERFAPQNPAGVLDNAHGIRAFVVGTGGAGLYSFDAAEPHSEVRNATTHGVLKLTLHADGYDWDFVPVAGKTFTDSGSGTCH